jgi:apolipoprotein N-acyltransferase
MMQSIVSGGTAALLLLGAVHVHGALAWLVCAPLAFHIRRRCGWGMAGLTGAAFGMVAAVTQHVPWLAETAARYFGLSLWEASAPAAALALVCGATFGMLLGIALRAVLRWRPGPAIIVAALLWGAWESLLLLVLPYYPWVSLAATQVGMPRLLQGASLAGQTGLSCAIAAAGTAFGLALVRGPHGVSRAWAAAGLLLCATLAAFGGRRLADAPQSPSGCTLAAIDAQIASGELQWPDAVERYAQHTRRRLAGPVSAIVWPESAIPGYPETDERLRRALRALANELGAPLITGGPRRQWTAAWNPQLFNSVYLIPANGPLQIYDKRRLVPFAEYWPPLFGGRPSWLPAEDVSAGRTAGVLTVPGCRLGVLVCFEADDPWLARELVNAGADALLVLSNDAQLARTAVRNEVAQVRLRAVETGLPAIRVANRGGSVIVDPQGRITQDGVGVLVATLPLPSPAAAVRWSVWLAALCWGAAAVTAVLTLLRHGVS